MNGFIDIILFGYRIGGINKKENSIIHSLPEKYTTIISGKRFEIQELKYNLVETENDTFYELDFEDLLIRFKNGRK